MNHPKLTMRERVAQELQSIPETTATPPTGQRQTLGPTRHARELAANTPIKIVRLEPVSNLRFRTGYERDPSEFETAEFAELVASITKDGINTVPVDVREVFDKTDTYLEVLTGERRTRAIRKAGLPNVLIAIREVDDRAADRIHEIENGPRASKAVYSRAIQYSQMLQRYTSQAEMAEHIGVKESSLSLLLQLLRKAPRGMWEKVEDPASLVFGDIGPLLKAFEKSEFKSFVAHSGRMKAKALLAQARKLTRRVVDEKPLEKEVFERKRGDRYFVQLPKDIEAADRKKIVELVVNYLRTKGN